MKTGCALHEEPEAGCEVCYFSAQCSEYQRGVRDERQAIFEWLVGLLSQAETPEEYEVIDEIAIAIEARNSGVK